VGTRSASRNEGPASDFRFSSSAERSTPAEACERSVLGSAARGLCRLKRRRDHEAPSSIVAARIAHHCEKTNRTTYPDKGAPNGTDRRDEERRSTRCWIPDWTRAKCRFPWAERKTHPPQTRVLSFHSSMSSEPPPAPASRMGRVKPRDPALDEWWEEQVEGRSERSSLSHSQTVLAHLRMVVSHNQLTHQTLEWLFRQPPRERA
jgi:hypothetical protein